MDRRSFIALASGLLIPYEPQIVYSFSNIDRVVSLCVMDKSVFDVLPPSHIENRVKYIINDKPQLPMPIVEDSPVIRKLAQLGANKLGLRIIFTLPHPSSMLQFDFADPEHPEPRSSLRIRTL